MCALVTNLKFDSILLVIIKDFCHLIIIIKIIYINKDLYSYKTLDVYFFMSSKHHLMRETYSRG